MEGSLSATRQGLDSWVFAAQHHGFFCAAVSSCHVMICHVMPLKFHSGSTWRIRRYWDYKIIRHMGTFLNLRIYSVFIEPCDEVWLPTDCNETSKIPGTICLIDLFGQPIPNTQPIGGPRHRFINRSNLAALLNLSIALGSREP